MNLRFLFTGLFLITSLQSISQFIDEKDFIHYGIKQGLSDNYVSGIVQDASGYIWIATHRGLNRFDGKLFKHFFQDDKYNPIPDNSIYTMKCLQNGELAIATDNGTQIISTKTLKQLNLSIADDDQLRYWSNACLSVLSDKDGNYGVSTKTGFYVFSSSGQLKKRYDYFSRKNIGEWMIFGDDIYQSPDGNIMQLNQEGLLLYDKKENRIADASIKYPHLKPLVKEKKNNLFFPLTDSQLLHINFETNSFDMVDIQHGKSASFRSCVDMLANFGWMTIPAKINDTTWALNCKTKGFFIITINPATKSFSCSPKKYFADKFCTLIFNDRTNKLWIGTDEGLFKQNSHPKIVETISLEKKILNGTEITALYISADKIFAGTDNNNILVVDKLSKKIIASTQLNISKDLSNYIKCFYRFNRDTLWAGTSSGLFWFNLRNYSSGKIEIDKNILSPSIYLFFADKKKNIWISNYTINSIYCYVSSTRSFQLINSDGHPRFRTNVTNVAEDKNGNIWISGDAIVKWNPVSKTIDTLIEHLPTQQNLKKGYAVMADSKGDIWTIVNDDGLAKLTGDEKHLRIKNFILGKNNYISPALLDDKIFLFTTKGVGYFDITTMKSITFNNLDGLPEGPATSFFFSDDKEDNSVWFACKNVIGRIPLYVSTDQLKTPVLHITALSILNDTTLNYPPEKIELNYNQEDVNIFYSAINFSDPENMQFSYRIKSKKDSSWIEAGDQQNILLTNISPGNYKLQLKVTAYDNKWPEQIKELQINIKPPFWRTSWFIISVALLLAALAYYLYRYRIKQIKQKANIDKQLAQTEMKALHSQMNPHFIFNCLNSIREMILNNENEQASLYLSKFARLIRITLDHSSRSFVSLEDTIDYLQRYLEMEQIRKSNFKYAINVDENLQPHEIFLPPMLIQPFIENAIWHGAIPDKELHINLKFKKEQGALICILDDDGMGIETSLKNKQSELNYQSVGIPNIKQRIHVLNEKYNLKSTVEIEDKSNLHLNVDTGTIVTLHLPIKTKESVI